MGISHVSRLVVSTCWLVACIAGQRVGAVLEVIGRAGEIAARSCAAGESDQQTSRNTRPDHLYHKHHCLLALNQTAFRHVTSLGPKPAGHNATWHTVASECVPTIADV